MLLHEEERRLCAEVLMLLMRGEESTLRRGTILSSKEGREVSAQRYSWSICLPMPPLASLYTLCRHDVPCSRRVVPLRRGISGLLEEGVVPLRRGFFSFLEEG